MKEDDQIIKFTLQLNQVSLVNIKCYKFHLLEWLDIIKKF